VDRIDQASLPLDQSPYVPPSETHRGSGVNVYVVDTGVDTTHAEFGSATSYGRSVSNVFNYFGAVTANTDGHGCVYS
jgi:subtilisin family serine protease